MVVTLRKKRAYHWRWFMGFSTVTAQTAAAMAATGFILVAGFQVFLALGASWGRAA